MRNFPLRTRSAQATPERLDVELGIRIVAKDRDLIDRSGLFMAPIRTQLVVGPTSLPGSRVA